MFPRLISGRHMFYMVPRLISGRHMFLYGSKYNHSNMDLFREADPCQISIHEAVWEVPGNQSEKRTTSNGFTLSTL